MASGSPLILFLNLVLFMSDKISILVVEDNDFVRMQIVGFLKGVSYEVVEAREGEGALKMMKANDNNIALAIVDVRMEPVGGFEFVRDMRSHEIKTPVVLVTGDQTSDLLEQAGKLGIAAVLMKPVEKDRLLMTVERTLKQVRRAH